MKVRDMARRGRETADGIRGRFGQRALMDPDRNPLDRQAGESARGTLLLTALVDVAARCTVRGIKPRMEDAVRMGITAGRYGYDITAGLAGAWLDEWRTRRK